MREVSWHKQRKHVYSSLVPLQGNDLARHHSCAKHITCFLLHQVRLDDFKLGTPGRIADNDGCVLLSF